MTRPNPTQLELDRRHADRAYEAAVDAIRVREAVRPLERRRLHTLAALVRAQGACRRAA